MAINAVAGSSTRWSEAEWQARLDLAACYRLADRFGFSDIIWNHITAKIPGTSDQFLLNRMGLRYDEICASNLVKVDGQGNVLDVADDVNITGFIIHGAIHRARPDIQVIFHTHAEEALAVTALQEGLMPLTQDAAMLWKNVAYHEWEGISIDPGECERLATSLGDKKVMIMRNHGLITCGASAGEAFVLMHYLNRACKVQLQALATGRKLHMPNPKVWQQAADQYSHFEPGVHEWPALVRLLDKEDPSYRD